MKKEYWKTIESIFHQALEIRLGEREMFLQKACAGDPELRAEVESLLAGHDQGSDALESAVIGLAADWVMEESDRDRPRNLGRYRILSCLGRGGSGEVYLAEDLRLRRKVALKLLLRQFSNDAERLWRFEQEARAASALNHPNIVIIYDTDRIDSQHGSDHFIASEFVEGQTLREKLNAEPLPIATVVEIGKQVASALAAAHLAGIIHRDIKPENIMIRADGAVKVLDFGLAKLVNPQFSEISVQTTCIRSIPGIVMGTVSYMSPEQAQGMQVDSRTDIFNLGIVLYEMIAGRVPFAGETTRDRLGAVIKNDAIPLSHSVSGISPQLDRIVMRALEKCRDNRYQDIQTLLADLGRLSENRTVPESKNSLWKRLFLKSR